MHPRKFHIVDFGEPRNASMRLVKHILCGRSIPDLIVTFSPIVVDLHNFELVRFQILLYFLLIIARLALILLVVFLYFTEILLFIRQLSKLLNSRIRQLVISIWAGS